MIKAFMTWYIPKAEGIIETYFLIGERFGLSMTSAKFWRTYNIMNSYVFNLRVKYKFFDSENK